MDDRLPSEELAAEQLSGRLPDVIRVAAGLAAGTVLGEIDAGEIAMLALDIVLACEDVCGIGGDV